MNAEVTPLPVADEIAAIAVALGQVDASHRRLRSRLAQRLGFTVTDLIALIAISAAAECTPTHLAAELGLTSGAVTTVIDRLVLAGQVHRVPKIGDRRSVLVELTPDGEATIEMVSGMYLGAISIALEAAPHVINRHVLDSLRSTADALDGAGGESAPAALTA